MTETQSRVSAKREQLFLGIIFLLALILRLVYLSEAVRSPLLFYPGLDPEAYDVWAQRIASGDWLGTEVFYQSPLYPYLLGIFYALFGRHLLWVYVVQILVGCADCLVIYGIGKRVFGVRAGILAGLFAAFYKPFIFYDAVLLKTFLEVFLIDLCLYLLLLGRDKKSRLWIFLSGLALGLGALARDNFIILILWFFPWLLVQMKKQCKALWSVYMLAGFILIIGASGIRNWVVARDFVLTTSQGGQNFYIGNHLKNLSGTYIAPDFVKANPFFEQTDFRREALRRTGRGDMKPSQVSNFWFKETFREIRSDQKLFWKRLALKLALFWNRKEIADNVSLYLLAREFSFLLRMPILEFGIIGPLGLMGLVFGLKRKKGILLGVYIFIYWVSVSLFFIFARYRLAVVGPLLVFAAWGLENLYEWFKTRNWKSLTIGLILLVIFSALVWKPLLSVPLDYAYYNLGNAYVRAGNFKKAVDAYQKAISFNPEPGEFWSNLGNAYDKIGNIRLSAEAYSEAVRREPENANARLGFGIALYKLRYFEDAERELRKALELNPNLQDARVYLEMVERRLQR